VQINEAISSFSRMKSMHKWLRERKERGAAMPKNQEDAQLMMRTDMQTGAAVTDEQKAMMKSMRKKAERRANKK
jgi:hypothetical protein